MIALIQASLGGFDKENTHVEQSMKYDRFLFTDENFPPRPKAMTPRLQAKIPKFFGWQLKPGYDFYLWLDGNIKITNPDTIKYFYEQCTKDSADFVVLRHPRRPNIRQEARYLRKGINQQSNYIVGRYVGEWTPEQVEVINKNKHYVDDLMVNGGIFMYRNHKGVQDLLKEWWYMTTRYSVFDQMAFPYLLKTSGLRLNVLDLVWNDGSYFKDFGHKYHAK